ncbi:heme exporter protein CcmD [Chachezhania sediminis]|uniref:heme exporter protein CcmD n=1 Tax=Chachezhania sediminis TaxID=2599291 RepID=UPI0018EED239|nr:heme exporter protein CcmD [Chachezhania sediminis]
MIPDLGKYTDTVLWSYAASIALLVGVVVATLWRGRKVRAELRRIEARMTGKGPGNA